jgi:hypothetical protein
MPRTFSVSLGSSSAAFPTIPARPSVRSSPRWPSLPPVVATFRKMLEDDRRRAGWSVELEARTRWPSWETYDRICDLFGWPQTFTRAS